jgi:hypothetical protein
MKLFGNKKGSIGLSYEVLIKVGLGILGLISLVSFLVLLMSSFKYDPASITDNDFKRIVLEIGSVDLNSRGIVIPIYDEDMLFTITSSAEGVKNCVKNSICLCYKKDTIYCETIENEFFKSKKIGIIPSGDIPIESKKISLKIIEKEDDLSGIKKFITLEKFQNEETTPISTN